MQNPRAVYPLSLQEFQPEQGLLCAGQQQGAYLDSIGKRCGPGSPGKAGKFWSWSLQELGVICEKGRRWGVWGQSEV